MNFELVSIAVGDVAWIVLLAFILGFLSKLIGLPPLVGFLLAGFILNTQDVANLGLFQGLADIGITLLLFTIGLKVNIRTLIKPHIWAVTGLHTSIIVLLFSLIIYGLTLTGITFLTDLDLRATLVVAFALSFSSTVFVVKVLEDKGELKSLHGKIAIGVLIMQDIAAVIFLAFSINESPSIWSFALFLLIPCKFFLHKILQSVGRGELLVLYGILLAMGGAEIFELVGLKGDLGALLLGMLLASHAKADDMAKSMLGFKDLFLIGFFLSIGLSGHVTTEIVIIAAIITPFIFIKSALFLALLLRFKLRARTSLLATLNLTNYSEFGLIVAAIGVSNNWIKSDWLIIIAIAMSFSFIISAILNAKANLIYSRKRTDWIKLQRQNILTDDRLLDIGEATTIIIGMGVLGMGAYDKMRELYGDNKVIGVDIDAATVNNLVDTGRNVIHGDPSDADFWDRVQENHTLKLIVLTLPEHNTTLAVLDQLQEANFDGQIAATTKFPEQAEELTQQGVMTVANIYTEAGAGFASHVVTSIAETNSPPISKL
ncbi:Putative glutathione-regulated potassium-efflux system protein KefB [hydrothermal vent metagenome]|uniref:Glutathione-regulated potassium-efflux system protein KefB n=1 Tax=hydrothermal vent metagenome TaxID=652676 RepID=A0A3B0VXX5_9ZZZZ